jgi:hypothetical protein
LQVLNKFMRGKAIPTFWQDSMLEWNPVANTVSAMWMTDTLGLKTCLYVSCPGCGSMIGIQPESKGEIKAWNDEITEFLSLPICTACGVHFLVNKHASYSLTSCPL